MVVNFFFLRVCISGPSFAIIHRFCIGNLNNFIKSTVLHFLLRLCSLVTSLQHIQESSEPIKRLNLRLLKKGASTHSIPSFSRQIDSRPATPPSLSLSHFLFRFKKIRSEIDATNNQHVLLSAPRKKSREKNQQARSFLRHEGGGEESLLLSMVVSEVKFSLFDTHFFSHQKRPNSPFEAQLVLNSPTSPPPPKKERE